MVERNIVELLTRYLQLLISEGVKVDRAILYGSYAKGVAGSESDIDLLLVLPDIQANDDNTAGLAWRLTRRVSTRIEPFLVGQSRFLTDNISPILNVVRREGIEIDFQSESSPPQSNPMA